MSGTLLFATRSRGKQRELREIFAGVPYRVVFPDEIGLPPLGEEDLLEDRETFEGNARRKAEYFARRSGLPTAAEDSGLEVFALGGEPGVRSRRFAAPDPERDQDSANNRELLRRLQGAPPARRTARYRAVAVYLSAPEAAPRTFEGECRGSILEAPRGAGGFGYDPLFLSEQLGLTFAEAPADAKHRVSHRGQAVRELAGWLASHPPG